MLSKDFLTYNALDACCTLEIYNSIWSDISDHGFDPAYQMTVDLFPVLQFMQSRGIKVERSALEVTKQDILASASAKQTELNQLVGRELNVNSSKACQQYFYVELGIPPYYDEGVVTVNDSALQRLSRGTAKRTGLRQAKLVQEIRGLQKLHGTYLSIEFDADERMRCSYNPRGTKFGRLSSSKTIFGTGMNAQNLPQEFKKFLVADPGYVLWEIDKRQAEWVVMAYLTGDANMIQVVEKGKDTHIHTASLMFNAEPEVIALDDKVVGYQSDPDTIRELRLADPILDRYVDSFPRTMGSRQCGKKANHALNYGEGYVKFALLNEIDQSEAKRFVAAYHLSYPGINSYYSTVQRQLQRDRTLTNCFGRKVRFMDQWGTDLWKAAYSMLPQSTVVDSLNKGLVQIYQDDSLTSIEGANIDVLAQVHDSILLQVPLSVTMSEEFAKIQEKVYNYVSPDITYNGRTFKIATDSKIGTNWSTYHSDMNPLGMREVKTYQDINYFLRNIQ